MKSITMASTGHEKEKLTVMLAAMADGTKLLPMVILKCVRRPHDIDIPAGIVVVMAPKSWANEEIIVATTGLATGQPAAKATCLGCLPGAHD